MKNRLLIFFIFTFSISFSSYAIELEIQNVLKLSLPESMGVQAYRNCIIHSDDRAIVRYSYYITYGELKFNTWVILRPRRNKSLEEVKQYSGIDELSSANPVFGIGRSFAYSHESGTSIELSPGVTEFISYWGSGISSDITQYSFSLSENEMYDHCIVLFINPFNAISQDFKICNTEENLKIINQSSEYSNLLTILHEMVNSITLH